MTKRPDSQDRARARHKHERCLCGDNQPCRCTTPSPGWHPRWWVPVLWGDLRLVYAELAAQRQQIDQLREMAMSQQDDLNAFAQRITDDVAKIRAEVDEIKAGHPDLDLSALEAAVGSLDQTTSDIDPSPEAPPADGGDVPPAA